jgi:hypothetical protein
MAVFHCQFFEPGEVVNSSGLPTEGSLFVMSLSVRIQYVCILVVNSIQCVCILVVNSIQYVCILVVNKIRSSFL